MHDIAYRTLVDWIDPSPLGLGRQPMGHRGPMHSLPGRAHRSASRGRQPTPPRPTKVLRRLHVPQANTQAASPFPGTTGDNDNLRRRPISISVGFHRSFGRTGPARWHADLRRATPSGLRGAPDDLSGVSAPCPGVTGVLRSACRIATGLTVAPARGYVVGPASSDLRRAVGRLRCSHSRRRVLVQGWWALPAGVGATRQDVPRSRFEKVPFRLRSRHNGWGW